MVDGVATLKHTVARSEMCQNLFQQVDMSIMIKEK